MYVWKTLPFVKVSISKQNNQIKLIYDANHKLISNNSLLKYKNQNSKISIEFDVVSIEFDVASIEFDVVSIFSLFRIFRQLFNLASFKVANRIEPNGIACDGVVQCSMFNVIQCWPGVALMLQNALRATLRGL